MEEPVAAPQAPEFVAAPTALLKNQSQRHKPQSLSQRQLLLQKNQLQLQFKNRLLKLLQRMGQLSNKLHNKPTNNLLKQLINKLLTKVNQDNLILPNQVNFGSRWWLLELVPFSFETSNGCRKSKST